MKSCRNTKNPNDKTFGVQEEPYDILFNNTRALYNIAVKERGSKPLIILLYNKGFKRKEEPSYPNGLLAEGITDKEKCPYNCTHDNRMLSCADTVVAHHSWNSLNAEHLRWLKKQQTDVPWVWYGWENPTNTHGLSRLTNIFQLTATYARDSDIWVPYFRVALNEKVDPSDTDEIDHAKGKTKLVINFMSNCVGFRINFIRKMKTHLQVDSFGRCHGNAGGCIRASNKCDVVQKQYKFYLALENTFCEDYHTEKFYRLGLIIMV